MAEAENSMCWELVQSKPNKNSKDGQVPAVVEPGPIGTDYGGGALERKLGDGQHEQQQTHE